MGTLSEEATLTETMKVYLYTENSTTNYLKMQLLFEVQKTEKQGTDVSTSDLQSQQLI